MNANYIIDLTCQICGCVQSNQNAILNHYYSIHFQKQCENDLNEFFGHFSLKFSRYCRKCNYDNGTNADIEKAFCHVCYHKLPEYLNDWKKNQISSSCKKSLKKDKSSDHKTQAKISDESKVSSPKVIKYGKVMTVQDLRKCRYCVGAYFVDFLKGHEEWCKKRQKTVEQKSKKPQKDSTHKCQFCSKEFMTEAFLQNHTKKCHKKQKSDEVVVSEQQKSKEKKEILFNDAFLSPKVGKGKKRKFHEQSEDVIEMAQPLVKTLLNKHFPTEGKISCLSAISSLITKDAKVCEFLAKKDIIEEMANLCERVENEPDQLKIFARIFSKLNGLKQGKELIDEVRMPIKAYKKLQDQMKLCEVSENPQDFAFTSEESTSKKIKREIMKTEQE